MMSNTFKSVKYTLTLFAACMLFSSLCLSLEIKVKDKALVDGETVSLGDIATFQPADDIRVDRLSAIEISVSPAPDTIRKIEKDLIMYRVAHHINGDKNITLSTPESIIVERESQVISGKTLEKIFTDYVFGNSPFDQDEIVIEKINTPSSIAFPKGRLDWEISEKQNNSNSGNISINVEFYLEGEPQRKIVLSGRVGIIKEVIKANRNINKGELISLKDITLVSEKGKNNKNSISSIEDVIGKRATRRIQADQAIQNGMVMMPPAIEKGAQVMIRAENEELVITASGKALEEGSVGDQIRVMNITSGKEIIATVKRANLVQVQF
ncbi:MAG: flagellar basal body P-ring formation protein FlgA [Deltaproteobacteria bacterium]|nr:flagellar basal body P-ring formation protein FlgA [Deltaproteobacteria bacterium]